MLAQRLGFEIKTKAISFDGESVTLRSGEKFIPQEKTILTFEKIRTLRFPSIFSKLGEIEVLDNSVLNLDKEKCGLVGSPTRVIKSYESSVGRRDCKFVEIDRLDEIIRRSLEKERVETSQNTGEKLEEAYFVGNVKSVAEGIAKSLIPLDVESKTAEEIAQELREKNVKTVLWEDSEKLKVLASKIAVLTGAGICADCISFRVEKGNFVMTRPALGGNVTADIIATSEMVFATVRTVKKDGADVIFSVGKGAIEYVDKIKTLAEKYGAGICCSRIVADSGKLPYESQVGLTGRTVCPKVYVAFGISGAVQHTCAIASAGTVIGVNIDKQARIFDYADYGVIADVKQI
jgi:electron transfer flavoprotein alpha subunit